MVDVPDSGWLYKPSTQQFPEGVGEQEDAICCIRVLQVTRGYMAGGIDTGLRRNPGADTAKIDSYFLLNSATGERREFTKIGELRATAAAVGISLALEPIGRVYSRFRYTWFDGLAAFLFFAPPVLGLALFGAWIVNLRKHSS